jgi:hypothetical protein
MALKPIDRYPAQIDADADYPHGKARNSVTFHDGTGTPYEKDIVNDLFGFQQALLVAASLEPTGTPDSATSSQYLDAVRAVARQSDLRSRLALRAFDPGAETIGSQVNGGVVTHSDGLRSLHVKAGADGVFAVGDSPVINQATATVPDLTQIQAVVRGGTRVLVVGNGGTNNASSTDEGATWSAGGSLSGTPFPVNVVWDETEFVAVDGVNQTHHSTNGSVWTPPSGDDVTDLMYTASGGLAVLTGGIVVACGMTLPSGGNVVFAVTSDHGVNWSLGGAIPPAIYVDDDTGSLAGNGGAEVYWLGKVDAVDRLDLWVSADGVTWEKRAELEGFSSTDTFNLRCCPQTGLLVAVQQAGSAVRVAASADGGYSWCEPVAYYISSFSPVYLSNGRLFVLVDGAFYATDRIL